MDHDQYEDTITNECLQQQATEEGEQPSSSGVDNNDGSSSSDQSQSEGQRSSGSSGSQSSYNPFDISMGVMTVYRVHITCSCTEFSNNQKAAGTSDTNGESSSGSHKNGKKQCARILPMKDQPWSGYMGSHANSYLLKKVNFMPTSQTTSSSSSETPPKSFSSFS
jgi:hypothetical protein